MTLLKHAMDLAEKGFHVFPLVQQQKIPLIQDFPNLASNDPKQIRKWWFEPTLGFNQPHNIGLSTTRFMFTESLVVVDVDNKGKKDGSGSLLKLEMEGFELPLTYTQKTPTGGFHLVYKTKEPVKQGVDVLGTGLDIRSKGGYIVGAGSLIENTPYTSNKAGISEAPAWLIERCGAAYQKETTDYSHLYLDSTGNVNRAIHYLENEAPIAVKGQGGDQTTYKVAAYLKDIGISPVMAIALMEDHWNDRSPPGWSYERLKEKVDHAYKYGIDVGGSRSPETQFDKIEEDPKLHPFEKLNEEFAFVVAGGGSHILWETLDHKGAFKLEHLSTLAFHQKLASRTMALGDGKRKAISSLWMKSDRRRSYDGICFSPGVDMPPQFYNLWRGFAVDPLEQGEKPTGQMKASVDAFLAHALENVCRGEPSLFNWLIGYFAHIVQKPGEKPLVALVFRGNKGVGKNALIDRVGYLLGNHYLLTSNRRYLTSNFNAHLENLLLFALDEAFWSGDKQAEGTLKDLITGSSHVIEHKGKEPYSVDNCTRVVIIGNEEWLVPASQDERRYAVFDVGEGRKQDRRYFQDMREGMERGGYRYLLRYLLDFRLEGIDINDAPSTDALHDQKVSSLDPFHQWWLDCLTEGKIVCSDFGETWTTEINKDRFRYAFKRYIKDRNIRSRIPEDRILGKLLKTCLHSVNGTGKKREEGELVNIYKIPDLEKCRAEWSHFIGHDVEWGEGGI